MSFRKSIKILPGVRLNLSKSGVSASLGPRGATVNKKVYSTKSGSKPADNTDNTITDEPVSPKTAFFMTMWIVLSGCSFFFLSFGYGILATIVLLIVAVKLTLVAESKEKQKVYCPNCKNLIEDETDSLCHYCNVRWPKLLDKKDEL